MVHEECGEGDLIEGAFDPGMLRSNGASPLAAWGSPGYTSAIGVDYDLLLPVSSVDFSNPIKKSPPKLKIFDKF